MLADQELRVTTSLGIAMFPEDGETADALLKNADTAMYRAKQQGRDNFQTYTPSMSAEIVNRVSLESDLRRALASGEFVLAYQPQMERDTWAITGAEALIRWKHPTKGLVHPIEFISVAEDTGLIVPIGEWVLREACLRNKAWQDAGLPPITITVNLSALQFQQANLVEMIEGVLAETGLEPRYLEFEITEGTTIHDADFAAMVLRELRAMGVRISIDDFGTGYSSLSYLKRFRIDRLKIDRSFVDELTTDANDAAIATAVIVMAHSLGLGVVAEGVETEEQLRFLLGKAATSSRATWSAARCPRTSSSACWRTGMRSRPGSARWRRRCCPQDSVVSQRNAWAQRINGFPLDVGGRFVETPRGTTSVLSSAGSSRTDAAITFAPRSRGKSVERTPSLRKMHFAPRSEASSMSASLSPMTHVSPIGYQSGRSSDLRDGM